MNDYYEDDVEIETMERLDEMIDEYEKERKLESINDWEDLFTKRKEDSVFDKLIRAEKNIIERNPRHSF